MHLANATRSSFSTSIDSFRSLATSPYGVLPIIPHRHQVHLRQLKSHLLQGMYGHEPFLCIPHNEQHPTCPVPVSQPRNSSLSCDLWLHRCQVLSQQNQVNLESDADAHV